MYIQVDVDIDDVLQEVGINDLKAALASRIAGRKDNDLEIGGARHLSALELACAHGNLVEYVEASATLLEDIISNLNVQRIRAAAAQAMRR